MILIRNIIVLLILVGCTTPSEIRSTEVNRILSTLSSDEMQGRGTFSQGIDKASQFIGKEFETIGLQPLEGLIDYRQSFEINSLSIDSAQVTINKTPIQKNNYFMRLSNESLEWLDSKNLLIKYIGEADDFRKSIGETFNSDKNELVIVSPKHEVMFERYQSYFSQPRLQLPDQMKKGVDLVFVLSDVKNIDQAEIKAHVNKEKKELVNMVGVIEGKRKSEMVLFSSHYDHLGIGKAVEGDSIYNGANDDASGVTAVIELARYFKGMGKPERTLVFAAFTAEEIGGYGSRYFSQQLKPEEIVAMLNIEMIGKVSKEGVNSAWMTGWNKSDLGEILKKNLKEVDFKFFENPYPEQNLFYRSDNATLARLGVPAHSISTTQIDIDTDYHQVSDELKTLDIENITNTIKAIATGVQGIVDGKQTPTRINPDEVHN